MKRITEVFWSHHCNHCNVRLQMLNNEPLMKLIFRHLVKQRRVTLWLPRGTARIQDVIYRLHQCVGLASSPNKAATPRSTQRLGRTGRARGLFCLAQRLGWGHRPRVSGTYSASGQVVSKLHAAESLHSAESGLQTLDLAGAGSVSNFSLDSSFTSMYDFFESLGYISSCVLTIWLKPARADPSSTVTLFSFLQAPAHA